MLEPLRPGEVNLRQHDRLPPFLASLVKAAANGHDLLPFVEAITKTLGFDSFMYGATGTPTPDHEAKSYVYTTLPREWVKRYDQMAYIEVDPRLALTWDSTFPLIWDQSNARGLSPKSDEFLDDALRFGIPAVSVSCFMAGTALMSSSRLIRAFVRTTIRLQAITRNLPYVLMFGQYFHEIFMRSVIETGMAPRAKGAPLSNRERECLALAAHGMTTEDIAIKLEVKPRTVQFHFDSIRTKLGAANRQEAIALAVQSGVVSAY